MGVPTPHRAFVFSDIHLSADGNQRLFNESARLASVIKGLAERAKSEAVELVLAGDVFDFLELGGYPGWQPELAAALMTRILEQNQGVVDALKALAMQPGATITLLIGNHDPEVGLTSVRETFRQRIGLDPARFNGDEELPGLLGYGRKLAADRVFVLHGDHFDHVNRIARRRLLNGASPAGFSLPSGSRLVYELLPSLCPQYPWVYYLPPGVSIWILLCINPQRLRQLLATHGQLSQQLVMSYLRPSIFSMSGTLSDASLRAETDEPPPTESEENPSQVLANMLAAGMKNAPGSLPGSVYSSERRNFGIELENFLGRALGPNSEPLPTASDTLASWSSLHKFLSGIFQQLGWIQIVNPGAEPHWLSQLGRVDRLTDDVVYSIGDGKTLIAGHTHGPRYRCLRQRKYVNSGAWVPVGFLIGESVQRVLSSLSQIQDNLYPRGPEAERSAWGLETPRTYVEVTPDAEVWLHRIEEDGSDRIVQR